MRFLCFAAIAFIVGFIVYVMVTDTLYAQQMTPAEVDAARIKHGNDALQETYEYQLEGHNPPKDSPLQQPYVPPKPSWTVAHWRLAGVIAGSVAALMTWFLVLLIASFMKPTSPPRPDSTRLPDAGIRLLPPLRR